MSDHLFKRNGVYYCWIYKNGRQIKRSTKCTDRDAAQLVKKRLERTASDSGDTTENAAEVTLRQALDKLVNLGCNDLSESTAEMYAQKGGHLIRLLARHGLPLQEDQILAYIDQRKNVEGAAGETVRKELVTLRRALQIVKLPISCIPKFKARSNRRKRWLPYDEFVKVAENLWGQGPMKRPTNRKVNRALWMLIAVFTGGRKSEVDRVRWEDLDYKTKTVWLSGTKTEKAARDVPVHPLLLHVLTPYRRPTGLIVGQWGNIRRDMYEACTRAGVPRCSPNDFRRTFASWLKQAGVDSKTTADMMGHSSTKMVDQVYAQLTEEHYATAVGKMLGSKWDTGGITDRDSESFVSPVSRPENVQAVEILVNAVLGGRIELPTRGFSVPESLKINRRNIKRKKRQAV